MAALDFELIEIDKILLKQGIDKNRFLLTIKRGWITMSIDGQSVLEFNRKRTTSLADNGQWEEINEYKWKQDGVLKKSTSWKDVDEYFKISISKLK